MASECGEDRLEDLAALLVAAAEPVPAFACILALRLCGIRNNITVLLGESVHACAACEIIGRLRAAMQHHDERRRCGTDSCWNKHLIVDGAGVAREASV